MRALGGKKPDEGIARRGLDILIKLTEFLC